MDRLLVVDLAATSKNWALTPDGERRLLDETPPGWRVHVVRAPTSSDGDGPPRPSDEVMDGDSRRRGLLRLRHSAPALSRSAADCAGCTRRRPASAPRSTRRWSPSDVVAHELGGDSRDSDRRVRRRPACCIFCAGSTSSIDQQRRTEWNKTPFVRMDSVLREMDSVRALIVGVGGIGGAAAERLVGARRAMHGRSAAGGAGAAAGVRARRGPRSARRRACRSTTSSCSRRR